MRKVSVWTVSRPEVRVMNPTARRHDLLLEPKDLHVFEKDDDLLCFLKNHTTDEVSWMVGRGVQVDD